MELICYEADVGRRCGSSVPVNVHRLTIFCNAGKAGRIAVKIGARLIIAHRIIMTYVGVIFSPTRLNGEYLISLCRKGLSNSSINSETN